MSSSKRNNDFSFSSPVRYRICVKGFLDDSWSERLGGMRINNQITGNISPMAELVGEVIDQTELVGVLNSLYEMHLLLVSVELLGKVDE